MSLDSQYLNPSGAAPGGLNDDLLMQPARRTAAGRALSRPWGRMALAVALVGVTTVVLHVSGALASTRATLEVMGFDPDRARLIADLVGASLATAAGALVTGAGRSSTVAGIVAGLALFGHTFYEETRAAIITNGPAGAFDPLGWALTVLTLILAFAVVAWATAAITAIVRGWLIAAGQDVVAFAGAGRRPSRLRRPASVLAVAVLLAVTLPVFSDMVNFSPDAHMRDGRVGIVGLAQAGILSPQLGPITGTSQLMVAGGSGQGGSGGTVLRAGAPWTAWQPTGQGQLVGASFAAPWIGGQTSTARIQVYLPPGYGSSNRSYPVVYAVPWASNLWTGGAGLTTMLDTMITSGTFPASIVVFVAQEGGAYPDSECVNAVDGHEWFETYLTNTIVPYVDATYHTIRSSAARSVLGFSQGGFCSTMLVLRHPDLFSTAVSLSGYYEAGILTNQTRNAYRPFGGNPTVEAQYSPLKLVGQLSPAARHTVFLILEGDPSDQFYGAQYQAMIAASQAAGVSVSATQSPTGHGWPTVRSLLPQMLVTLAQREAALGVFA